MFFVFKGHSHNLKSENSFYDKIVSYLLLLHLSEIKSINFYHNLRFNLSKGTALARLCIKKIMSSTSFFFHSYFP